MSFLFSLAFVLMTVLVKSEASGDGDVVVQSSAVPSVHVSYNESLRLVTEARADLENITRAITLISEDIARNAERQNEVRDYQETRDNEMLIQAVSVWVSWLLANSLCHGDLNMTGADTLWRHSRSHNKQRLYRGFSHGTGQMAKPNFTIIYSGNSQTKYINMKLDWEI